MGVTRRNALAAIAGGGLLLAGAGTGATMTIGAPHPPHEPKFDLRLLSPQQMREDLDFLVQVLHEVSVDPFQMTPRAQFERRFAEVRASLRKPLSTGAFYLRIAPLFAFLNDGHLSTDVANLYAAYRERGGRAFPFNLRFDEDGNVYAADGMAPEVPQNSRILSVDGLSADVLSAHIFALVSGQNRILKRRWAPDKVRHFFFARYGDRAQYAVRFIAPGSTTASERAVKATNLTEFRARLPKGVSDDRPPYAFTRIGADVGYIDYRSCTDLERFKTFCRTTFANIRQHPVRGIIVDIRNNDGGRSALNPVLCSYLSPNALQVGSGFSFRANDRLRHEYGWLKYSTAYFPAALFAPNGKVLTYDFSWYHPQPGKHNALRFDGPVYLLVSAQSFSAAMDCAQLMKDSRVATLVGEETAEPVNSNGEVYNLYAPHSAIAANFPTKYFFSKNYRNGEGVKPDVPIEPTEADIQHGRDPVLQYAISAITASRG